MAKTRSKAPKASKAEKPGKKAGKASGKAPGKASDKPKGAKKAAPPLADVLRVPEGERLDLSSYDTRATPGGPVDKAAALADMARMGERLADLQERLYAASTAGDRRRMLLVLQGMDTSGKGGTVKHVIGLFNPSGCRIKAFKAPTAEEQNHPFLWRIMKALPERGEIGIFDRSHYEDVLIARVRDLVPRSQLGRRYGQINRFEKSLTHDGVTVIKCFLHLGKDEQRDRLLERLDRPDKHWKFNPGDIEERAFWPAYQEAYEIALERCSTEAAPWFVIPADRKWYRNWAISKLLLEHLESLDPQYPKADFDVAESRERLLSAGWQG
ncbi:PPK2 family polyphosphate kinase [Streptomyces sp. NPDC050418]|uniref:PPK2 family polyphosphate kinase n=1 Tax=Streptomyces sp. NPDC050418 TaxID=3365612 RepID=UPI0037A1EB27